MSGYTDYASTNLTLAGKLWDELDFDVGVVALPNLWAAEKGIPIAQPFPWDQNKGIYVLNSHHNIHCLVRFRFPRRKEAGT